MLYICKLNTDSLNPCIVAGDPNDNAATAMSKATNRLEKHLHKKSGTT